MIASVKSKEGKVNVKKYPFLFAPTWLARPLKI